MNYTELKVHDAAGHPVTGAFNADTTTAAAEWNAANITNTALPIQKILKFLLLDNTYKIDDGSDTQDRSLWQRMKEVVALADTPTAAVANPWGSSSLGNITEIQQIKTHQLYDLFVLSAQGNLSVDLADGNFKIYLAGTQSSGCMSAAQETALLALSQISFAAANGYPVLNNTHIAHARSL